MLTALFTIGFFQYLWLSVVFVRKGFAPSTIRLAMLPLLSIWVLIWPAYDNTHLPLYTLALFFAPITLAKLNSIPFARHLKLCWHALPPKTQQPSPWLMLIITLWICAQLFALAPELGFGLALSFTLAWHLADIIDRLGQGLHLGLPKNPQQTLAAHLLFVLFTSFFCSWSLQLYHDIPWHQFFITTTIVGLFGSMIRALIATGWNMPLTFLAMSFALWLL
ncbi:MAG: hypothetical protein Q9N67_00605 [Ghiorsea sp.]|nr:hypothetical protein [Ghiorsea sp.]